MLLLIPDDASSGERVQRAHRLNLVYFDGTIQNRLLAVRSREVHARLQPDLIPVELALGRVIYEAHDILPHVYFPTTAIVSLLYTMEDGSSAEMGMAGCNGVVGIAVFMGGDSPPPTGPSSVVRGTACTTRLGFGTNIRYSWKRQIRTGAMR